MQDRGYELPRISHRRSSQNSFMKLSEKGYEQRSDRGFGWYTEGEIDRKAPLWRPEGLRCERVRGFSDSFRKPSEKPHLRAKRLTIRRLIAT